MPKVRPLTEAGRDKERDAAIKKAVYEKIYEEKGVLRLEDIAAKCGITRNTLYRYLNHPGWMPLQTYRDICRVIGEEANI